jgi:hypothetical protein
MVRINKHGGGEEMKARRVRGGKGNGGEKKKQRQKGRRRAHRSKPSLIVIGGAGEDREILQSLLHKLPPSRGLQTHPVLEDVGECGVA